MLYNFKQRSTSSLGLKSAGNMPEDYQGEKQILMEGVVGIRRKNPRSVL
jgi:hypothetical protein